MRLAQADYENAETGCCAKLDATLWDGRKLEWKDKPFLKDHVRSFFHIPLNFGSVISRGHAAIEEAEAYPKEPIWLSDEVSPWGSEVYVAVDRDIPHAKMARLSGTFLTKVFEGPYRNVGKWLREMDRYVADQGLRSEKTYFYYATCPKCAKHYGKNTVVLFAQVV